MIEFSNKEQESLIELIYLGNFIVNATRTSKDRIKKYDKILAKIKKNIEEKKGELFKEEDLYYRIDEFIDFYNKSVLFQELSKQYADFLDSSKISDFGTDREKALRASISNRVIRKICEDELKTHGFSIINISLPDINEKIEEEILKVKKLL